MIICPIGKNRERKINHTQIKAREGKRLSMNGILNIRIHIKIGKITRITQKNTLPVIARNPPTIVSIIDVIRVGFMVIIVKYI